MADWESIRADFPLLERCVYLDTASVSPSPTFLRQSILEFFDEKEDGFLSAGWREKAAECRDQLAAYLDVDTEEILFLSNTTEALNTVANSIAWEAGDEVIISDVNFSSNVVPWLGLADQGVEVDVLPSEDGAISLQRLERTVSQRTRLVSLPHVSSATGHRLDLGDLGDAVGHVDPFVSIDGVQAIGYRRPDLADVDAYAFSIFKWLLGPFGLGVLYLNREVVDEMDPPNVGYGSVVDGPSFRFDEFRLKESPQKFQYAHSNYPAIYCLSALLDYFADIGFDAIQDRVQNLSGYLIEELDALSGVRVVTRAAHRGGIVAFEHRDVAPDEVVQRLAAQDVHVAARGGSVRASCHFYNTHADVDALVSAVDRLAGG